MTLNNTELLEYVDQHCGTKIASNEDICDSCKKKKMRARFIQRQKDWAWSMYEKGYFRDSKVYVNKDKSTK